jgi:hypothetical protein
MAQNRIITMSRSEITSSEITQKADAGLINVTEQYFHRLLRRYRTEGPEGIISGHRGSPATAG